MKIIFLDVDGVLNSYRNVAAFGGIPFPEGSKANEDPRHREKDLDAIAVGMVRSLCEKAPAKVVLHSTWRKFVKFDEFGKRWNLPIIGMTDPDRSKPGSIRDWLAEHRDVTEYLILDDDDMQDIDHQVFTMLLEGMTYANYLSAKEILKCEPSSS